MKAASIDRVELGFAVQDTSNFTLTEDADGKSLIKATTAVTYGEIYFWLTLAPEESKKHLLARPLRSFVFGNNGGERLCFFIPGESGYLYCSKPIQLYMRNYSSKTA